jgi:CRP-like cAMP-binding protein
MCSCPKNGIAMLISNKSSIENKLLALLPARDFDLVSRDLEHVDLPRRTPLAKFREPFTHIHFLTSGIASVVVVTPEGNKVEGGIFGCEGYVPTSATTGIETSPHDVNIQLAGAGYRMNFEAFRSLMKRSDSFAKVVGRSMEAFAIQLSYTAASNAIHDVNERLARWILMCHDRVDGDEINLTHDFMSLMLAVRRPSVTTALHILEGNGFIRSTRGTITIRDRAALEEFARDAYGRPEEEYRRLMNDLF